MIVAERDLVEAIESTLFVLPAVTGLSQDLGIPGLRGRITKLSHPLANLCGDATSSEREADALIEKVRQRYKGLAFGWITGPSTRPADLPRRLEAAGFEHADSIAGMALTDLAQRIDVNPRVRVREANWDEAINQSEMMARAYGLPTEVNRLLNELIAASLDRIKTRGYFAYVDGDAPPRGGRARSDLRCERALKIRELVRLVGEIAVELQREGRAVDERAEVCRDRRRELGRVAEVRRNVGEVLDDVRVIALPEERAGHPLVIARVIARHQLTFRDHASQTGEAAVFVGAVTRMVPAHEVEQLMAGREPYLTQAFVGLHA